MGATQTKSRNRQMMAIVKIGGGQLCALYGQHFSIHKMGVIYCYKIQNNMPFQ